MKVVNPKIRFMLLLKWLLYGKAMSFKLNFYDAWKDYKTLLVTLPMRSQQVLRGRCNRTFVTCLNISSFMNTITGVISAG